MKILALLLCIASATATAAAPGPLSMVGVSESGAEFGSALPGVYNQDYTFPDNRSIHHFVALRPMNFVRLPFRWERLQQAPLGILDPFELELIRGTVANVTGSGAYIALDPHNYARYQLDGTPQIIGGNTSLVTIADFADFWTRLATEFVGNPRVIFALMNEPYGMPTMLWAQAAQAAINAIRATGAKQLIFVPGNGYTGAHSWTSGCYDTSGACITNAQALANITDPADNFVFEMHQYLDADSSGTGPCVSATVGADALVNATAWLRTVKQKAFLGEFGAFESDICAQAVNNMLSYMEANADCWLGWSWWAAGPWWGDYPMSLEPNLTTEADKPQYAYLQAHLPR